jgi:amino acid adenylation domain-containing protein
MAEQTQPALPALPARFLRGLTLAPRGTAIGIADERVSYEQVHELALRWAGALLHAAPERPRVLGVLVGKSLVGYAGILASLYTGAAVAPLNPGYPAARTRRMIDTAQVSALIADESGLAALAAAFPDGCDIPVLAPGHRHAGGFRAVPAGPPVDEPRPVDGGDPAYVLFTSGSTGRPKGVRITHANLAHYFGLIDRHYRFTVQDVFSQTFDLNFDCAIFDLFAAWGAGASVHPIPPAAYRDLPGFAGERGITVWFSTPSAISATRRLGGLGPGALPGLRWSLFAGEALAAADAAEWQAAAAGSVLENIYGPTELTITVSGHRWRPAISPASCVNGVVPIGTVHEGHRWLLLAADGLADDKEGELCVAGPQLTPGYLDPRDGDGRFLERDGRRWYRTGDRVRVLPDGELAYLGRTDSQVQIQGWRVELPEIEHAVRSCAGVTGAVAVTRAAAHGLEIVVFHTGAPRAPAEFTRALRDLLPHGMLPREYRHVDQFPVNANRKIDRGALAATAALPAGNNGV